MKNANQPPGFLTAHQAAYTRYTVSNIYQYLGAALVLDIFQQLEAGNDDTILLCNSKRQ